MFIHIIINVKCSKPYIVGFLYNILLKTSLYDIMSYVVPCFCCCCISKKNWPKTLYSLPTLIVLFLYSLYYNLRTDSNFVHPNFCTPFLLCFFFFFCSPFPLTALIVTHKYSNIYVVVMNKKENEKEKNIKPKTKKTLDYRLTYIIIIIIYIYYNCLNLNICVSEETKNWQFLSMCTF